MAEEKKKVVCYYTNWSRFRNSKGKFLPKYIDYNLCTHIVYSYALINESYIVDFISPAEKSN